MKTRLKRMSFFAFVALSPWALGEVSADKSADAKLLVAHSGEQLEVNLEVRSDRLLSFAHGVQTNAQKQELYNMQATLNSPFLVVAIEPKSCNVLSKEIDTSSIYVEESFQALEKTEQELKASDEPNTISVKYKFNCVAGTSIDTVSLTAFRQFPAIKRVDSSWKLAEKNGEKVLTPEQNIIVLK